MFSNMIGRVKLEQEAGDIAADDIDPIAASEQDLDDSAADYDRRALLAQVLKVSSPNVELLRLAGNYGYMNSASVESLSYSMSNAQWNAAVEGLMDTLKEKLISAASTVASKATQFFTWAKTKLTSIFTKSKEAEQEYESVSSSVSDQDVSTDKEEVELPPAKIILDELKSFGTMLVKWPLVYGAALTSFLTGGLGIIRAAGGNSTMSYTTSYLDSLLSTSVREMYSGGTSVGWMYDVSKGTVRYVSAAVYKTRKSIAQNGFVKGTMASIFKMFKSFNITNTFKNISLSKLIEAAKSGGKLSVGAIVSVGKWIGAFWRSPLMSLILIITSIFAVVRVYKRIKKSKGGETAEA